MYPTTWYPVSLVFSIKCTSTCLRTVFSDKDIKTFCVNAAAYTQTYVRHVPSSCSHIRLLPMSLVQTTQNTSHALDSFWNIEPVICVFFVWEKQSVCEEKSSTRSIFYTWPSTTHAMKQHSFRFLRESEHSVSSILFFTLFSLQKQGNCGRERWRTPSGHDRVVEISGMRTWQIGISIWSKPQRRTQRHTLLQSVFWRFVFLESNKGMRRESVLLSMGSPAVWFWKPRKQFHHDELICFWICFEFECWCGKTRSGVLWAYIALEVSLEACACACPRNVLVENRSNPTSPDPRSAFAENRTLKEI